jgi:chorismate synthase
MTTGEELCVRVAMKPIPSLRAGLASIEFASGDPVQATYQRSDVTSVPAASVVGEAVLALELGAAFLEKFGGDALVDVRLSYEAWAARVREL